ELKLRRAPPSPDSDLDPLDHPADLPDQLARDLDSRAPPGFGRPRGLEPRDHRLRDRHARHLVVEELGLPLTAQRQDAGDHGNAAMARPPEELLEQLGTEDRSSDREARTGLHLVLEAADLLVQAERARIDEDPGEEPGRPRNRLSPDIPPPVQPGDQP